MFWLLAMCRELNALTRNFHASRKVGNFDSGSNLMGLSLSPGVKFTQVLTSTCKQRSTKNKKTLTSAPELVAGLKSSDFDQMTLVLRIS